MRHIIVCDKENVKCYINDEGMNAEITVIEKIDIPNLDLKIAMETRYYRDINGTSMHANGVIKTILNNKIIGIISLSNKIYKYPQHNQYVINYIKNIFKLNIQPEYNSTDLIIEKITKITKKRDEIFDKEISQYILLNKTDYENFLFNLIDSNSKSSESRL
ncbi:MAG: hypothetical protein QXO60_00060 [Candidatus Micrarchaeia archaeon]